MAVVIQRNPLVSSIQSFPDSGFLHDLFNLFLLGISLILVGGQVFRPAKIDLVFGSETKFHACQDHPSLFMFIVTRVDDRFGLGLGSLYKMLSHMSPSGYNCSVNIFLYNMSNPGTYDDDLRFLESIHPEIPVRFREISMEQATQVTGIYFPYHLPVVPGQIRGRNMATLRLFIPQMYTADWYFYMDDDVIYTRGEFFPEVMEFTGDQEKVLFAVQDYCFTVDPDFRRRIWAYRKDYPGMLYYGSGFLFMRGGEILRSELRKTLDYFVKHMELLWIEQDALNLAFNTSRVLFLPWKFCVVPTQFDQAKDIAYGFHHAAERKAKDVGFVKDLITEYQNAKEKWKPSAI
jgi:hypothetical protein